MALQPGEYLRDIGPHDRFVVNARGDIVGIQNVGTAGTEFRGSSTTFATLTDAATADLPTTNGPLAAALSSKLSSDTVVTTTQAVVDTSLSAYNTTVQPKIDTSVAAAVGSTLDGLTFATVQAMATYVRGLITNPTPVPTVPVPSAAPYLLFPSSATVTISNASPGVITWTGHGKLANEAFQLTTTGALPTGYSPGVVYYVKTVLGVNTFTGSLTPGGAVINTSSAGSGVHTGWSTADSGESAVIVPGTYTTATPTSVNWTIKLDGVNGANYTLPSLIVPTITGAGHQISITENYVFGGQTFTGLQSVIYTINTPPAIPAPNGTLGPIVINSNVATCPHALWTNSPTSYTQKCYDNLGNVLGTATGAGGAGLLSVDTSTLGGLQIRWGELATNATGPAAAEIFSAFATIAGGQPPTYTGGIEPGFVAGTYQVGVALTIDFGAALNSPQGYDVQILRYGVAAVNTGASATNVTSFSYTPVSLDSGAVLSATVVPRNAAGPGPSTTIPGVVIAPAAGGGVVGTISFVDVSALGSSGASATVSPPLPPGAQAADLTLAFCGINFNGYTWNTPSGWTANGGNSNIATPNGLSVNAFSKVLGSSESTPTFTATGSDYKQGTLIAYRGATRVVATAVTTNNSSNASGFTITWPSVTTDAANQVVVLAADLDPVDGSIGPVTLSNLPAGSTVRSNVGAEDGNWEQQILIEVPVAAAGATGTYACTVTTDASATGWIARTTAIGL